MIKINTHGNDLPHGAYRAIDDLILFYGRHFENVRIDIMHMDEEDYEDTYKILLNDEIWAWYLPEDELMEQIDTIEVYLRGIKHTMESNVNKYGYIKR